MSYSGWTTDSAELPGEEGALSHPAEAQAVDAEPEAETTAVGLERRRISLNLKLKREARFGLAALLSFLILVGVLIVNRGPKTKKSDAGKAPPTAALPGPKTSSGEKDSAATAEPTRKPVQLALNDAPASGDSDSKDKGGKGEPTPPKGLAPAPTEEEGEKKADNAQAPAPAKPEPDKAQATEPAPVAPAPAPAVVEPPPEPTPIAAPEPAPAPASAPVDPPIQTPTPAPADLGPAVAPEPMPVEPMPTAPAPTPEPPQTAPAPMPTPAPITGPEPMPKPATPEPTPAEPLTPPTTPVPKPADPKPAEEPAPVTLPNAPAAQAEPAKPETSPATTAPVTAPATTPVAAPTPAPTPAPAKPAAEVATDGNWIPLPNGGRRKVVVDDDERKSPDPAPVVERERPTPVEVRPAATADRGSAGADEHGQVETVPHVVQRLENFWTISRLYYGSGRFYKALWSANRGTVQQIDKLYVGQTIRIPPPESLDPALIDPERANPTSGTSAPVRKTSRAAAPGPKVAKTGGGSEVDLPVTDPFARRKGGADEPDAEAEAAARVRRPIHKVMPRETLRSIARDTLGDSHRADEILDLNTDVIDDPAHLVTGQVLKLPDDAKSPQGR